MPDSPRPSLVRSLGRLRGPLVRALARPFQSLPSRIIFSVFGVAVVSSLAVTLVSTSSIESFLRQEIDRQLPAALQATAKRLDLWYSQRRLDIETFARSATVVEGLERATQAAGAARRPAALEGVQRYLVYVLERFPQYEAIFLLDAGGDGLLWVGERVELGPELEAELARIAEPDVGPLRPAGGRAVQIVSSPVGDGGRRFGSLHAVVRTGALVPVLRDADLGQQAVAYLVGPDGRTVMQSPGVPPRARYPRELPSPGAEPQVQDYAADTGQHVVGSALRLSRFGWTLVVEEPYGLAFAPVVSVIRRILAINLGIVVVFGLVAFQFARSIVRPIQALSDAARRIARGETDVAVPLPVAQDEIEVLTRVFNEMSTRLQRDQLELERNRLEIERANERLVEQNQELQRVNEVLEQLSITDGLTKLHNHRFFQDHLRRELRRCQRTNEPLALVLIDIDDFKQLNDRYGHAVGDAVLRQVAEVMNGVVRETDLLARYGGEEFALVASRTDLAGARSLGEKIRLAVAQARFPAAGRARAAITVSVGVAIYRGDEKALFNEADQALYRAKAGGKDCLVAAVPPRKSTKGA